MRKIILALAIALVSFFGVSASPATAASGYLSNCAITRTTTSASSVCNSVIADVTLNGLQRIRITCFNGVTYVSEYGAYVLRFYYSTAYCDPGYTRVAGFETIQRL